MPISLEDQFNIKTLDSTIDYVGNAFTPAESDGPLVYTLRQLGAMMIAITIIPQSTMVSDNCSLGALYDDTN